MKNPLSKSRVSQMVVFTLTLLTLSTLFALTLVKEGEIPKFKWTYIEGQRRFDAGTNPTNPRSTIHRVVTAAQESPFQNLTLTRSIMNAFRVEGLIWPYYLTADIPATALTGAVRDGVKTMGANINVNYKEFEAIFDDTLMGVAPGRIIVTLNQAGVITAKINFGSAQLGFHELEYSRTMAVAGALVPAPTAQPTHTPIYPTDGMPLVKYIKQLP